MLLKMQVMVLEMQVVHSRHPLPALCAARIASFSARIAVRFFLIKNKNH